MGDETLSWDGIEGFEDGGVGYVASGKVVFEHLGTLDLEFFVFVYIYHNLNNGVLIGYCNGNPV